MLELKVGDAVAVLRRNYVVEKKTVSKVTKTHYVIQVTDLLHERYNKKTGYVANAYGASSPMIEPWSDIHEASRAKAIAVRTLVKFASYLTVDRVESIGAETEEIRKVSAAIRELVAKSGLKI